jgi:hypothetical protein
MTDDLTDAEVGRDNATDTLHSWPSSNVLPDQYAGAVPSREFETAPLGGGHRGSPVPAVPPPADAPAPEKSIAPPPGHTAQP